MATGVICMFHIGRAGSTVLGDLLNQHPSFGWDSEIYAPQQRLWDGRGDPVMLMRQRAALLPRRWYGFEFKAFHVRLVGRTLSELVTAYRSGGNARFIVLRRVNTLRKIVSTAVARGTGRFHLFGQSTAPRQPDAVSRVRIDPRMHFIDGETRPLVEFLAGFDRFHALLDELLLADETLRLSYEDDILPDPLHAYRTACGWLGEEPIPVVTRFARTTPFPLRQVLENFEEVALALDGTPWAWMLDG